MGRRRWLAALIGAAVIYCVAIEVWLPRDEPFASNIEAVVVLSSGLRKDGTLDANAAARLRRGADVANATAAVLFTTRVQRQKPPILLSDSAQKRVLDSALLRPRWTIADGIALNTRDEASRVSRSTPVRRIALVTSRLHTRRACATFERLGFVVTCVSASRERPLWKTPYFVLYESAALIKYRLNGWI
jgi:uncharacterized SAM-binding protein YcdF (DUF218 family)